MKDYWVYMLFCDNGSYYTGYTSDLERRYQEHLQGKTTCKYTRSFKPLGIAQSWKILGDKSLAMKVEKYIKKMSKEEKIKLLTAPASLAQLFQCEPLLK